MKHIFFLLLQTSLLVGATGLLTDGIAGTVSAAPEISFDLRASKHADGSRSSFVRVGGVRSALPDGCAGVRSAAATSDGKYVFFAHGLGRYHLPATQLDRGWINSSALSVFDGVTGRRINTVMLDDPLRGAANPWGVAVNADWIAVTHFGTHEVSVIPRKAFFEKLLATQGEASADLGFMRAVGRRRIQLKGRGPTEISFLANGRLAVKLRFAEATAIVDPATGAVEEPDLPGGLSAAVAADPVRLGEAYFNDATLCYQSWQSCGSCHLDGENDGLEWDFAGSGGGLGHPEATVNLKHLTRLTDTCVKGSYRDDHLFEAPAPIIQATEAYVKSGFATK